MKHPFLFSEYKKVSKFSDSDYEMSDTSDNLAEVASNAPTQGSAASAHTAALLANLQTTVDGLATTQAQQGAQLLAAVGTLATAVNTLAATNEQQGAQLLAAVNTLATVVGTLAATVSQQGAHIQALAVAVEARAPADDGRQLAGTTRNASFDGQQLEGDRSAEDEQQPSGSAGRRSEGSTGKCHHPDDA